MLGESLLVQLNEVNFFDFSKFDELGFLFGFDFFLEDFLRVRLRFNLLESCLKCGSLLRLCYGRFCLFLEDSRDVCLLKSLCFALIAQLNHTFIFFPSRLDLLFEFYLLLLRFSFGPFNVLLVLAA